MDPRDRPPTLPFETVDLATAPTLPTPNLHRPPFNSSHGRLPCRLTPARALTGVCLRMFASHHLLSVEIEYDVWMTPI